MARSMVVAVLFGLGLSLAATAQAPQPFPDITVYPNPNELEIDRLSRRIIGEIPHRALLPRLQQDLSSRSGDGQVCEDTRKS